MLTQEMLMKEIVNFYILGGIREIDIFSIKDYVHGKEAKVMYESYNILDDLYNKYRDNEYFDKKVPEYQVIYDSKKFYRAKKCLETLYI